MTAQRLLAINVGSSTLKVATFDREVIAPATVSRLTERARTEIHAGGDAQDRLVALLQALPEDGHTPDVVVHRIVHGGGHTHGLELDANLLAELDALAPLAPLHQPAALAFARAARARWPQARHGVAFDTSFHAALAPWSRRLPIPADWDALRVRRYGFHGLAFASALSAVAAQAPDIRRSRAVFAHLGGGCSVCAVDAAVSRDTTMALTPLGGVPGPTRSGDLDPGAVLYLLRQTGRGIDCVERRLSHEGGMAGIAGHGDVRRLLEDDAPASRLAIDQFVMRIAQAIAAMATSIGGIDHLVFSGGIGHRAPVLRERVVERLGFLGVRLDTDRNRSGVPRIDTTGKPAVWNVAIDEERELAESALVWLDASSVPHHGVQP